MRLRVFNPQGKFFHLPLTALGALRKDMLVQLRYQDFISSAEGEVALYELNHGQYAELLEPNTYSVLYDGVIQSSISPVCYAGYPLTLAPQIIHDDGDVVISTDVTITKDMFYNSLYVTETGILRSGNFRIFVKYNCRNDGKICNDGADAISQSGGVLTASGFYPSFGAGVNGGSGGTQGGNASNGNAGGDITDGVLSSLFATSGTAGGGGKGIFGLNGAPTDSGSGGTIGAAGNFALLSMWWAFMEFLSGLLGRIFTLTAVKSFYGGRLPGAAAGGGGGGVGGGSPSGDGVGGKGGGTGAPAGVLFFYATTITGKGIFSANGGRGGDGGVGGTGTLSGWGGLGGGGGGGGGGAGGNGGIVYLVCYDKTNFTGTVTATGGARGVGGKGGAGLSGIVQGQPRSSVAGGDGTDGQSGIDGVVMQFNEALY